MKKRVFAIFLAGMMVSISACGGGANGNQSEEKPGQEQQETEIVPGSFEATDVEAAGEDGPKVDNPKDPGNGPTVTEGSTGEADPNEIPGGEGSQMAEDEEAIWEIEGAGLIFNVPKSITEAKGVILQRGGGETIEGSGVTYYAVAYLGVAQEEYDDFLIRAQESEPSEEEVAVIGEKYRDLFTVYSVDGSKIDGDPEEFLSTYLDAAGIKDAKLEKMTEVEGYTFFFSDESTDENIEVLGEFEEEYRGLAADLDNIKNSFECIVPVKQ